MDANEQFGVLNAKASAAFAALRELPAYGATHWEAQFKTAFKHYTAVWQFQRAHRPTLDLQRYEIGDVASMIGQLYFLFYLRSSQTEHLRQSFVWYRLVLEHEYYTHDAHTLDVVRLTELLSKTLRFHVRFLVVCILLQLPNWAARVQQCARACNSTLHNHATSDDSPFRKFEAILDEMQTFVEADSTTQIGDSPTACLMPLRQPLLTDFARESRPRLRLVDSILVGAHATQSKASQMTLDVFHVLCALEVPLERNVVDRGAHTDIDSHPNESHLVRHAAHRNPHKYIMLSPSAPELLMFLAVATHDLSRVTTTPAPALLLYLSLGGLHPSSAPLQRTSLLLNPHCPHEPSEQLSAQDLMPFTRHALLLIIDDQSAQDPPLEFLSLTSAYCAPLLVIGAPVHTIPLPHRPSDHPTSLMALFLQSPLQGLCVMCGVRQLSNTQHDQSEALLTSLFSLMHRTLAHTQPPPPASLSHFLDDPFAARLLLRSIFFHNALLLHSSIPCDTSSQHKDLYYLPSFSVPLPPFIVSLPEHTLTLSQIIAIISPAQANPFSLAHTL